MPRPTRVLFLSDNHSGHRGGLTPPPWQYHASPPGRALAGQRWARTFPSAAASKSPWRPCALGLQRHRMTT